jgi:hypothetical protein
MPARLKMATEDQITALEIRSRPQNSGEAETEDQPRLSLRGLGTGSSRPRALKARKIGPAAPPAEAVWLWHTIGQ